LSRAVPRTACRTAAACAAALAMLAQGVAGASTRAPNVAARSLQPQWIVSTLHIKENAALHALLPAAIRSSGTLTIATDPETPPYESYAANNKTFVGADVDLASAIAAELGLKPSFTAISFPGIIPALESGRFDMAISAMGDTPAREAQVNFVDYSTDGNALIVQAGNPDHIKAMADLCGKTVAVLQGSVMLGLVQTQDQKCSNKITVSVFSNQSAAYLAVQAGRAAATITDYAVAAYFIAKSANPHLQVLTFHTYGEGYNAVPVPKSDVALLLCVQQALMRLMMNGDYRKILSAWSIEAGAIQWPTINDGLRFNQPTG
jgi:polar amino acid transport system substrate-binding protein